MLLAYLDGRFVWNIHMPGTITYVGCTFTPHPHSQYFNVKCTKSFLYARGLPNWMSWNPMGCDFLMIYDSYINVFSHESAILF
jgi:hypothetical protein